MGFGALENKSSTVGEKSGRESALQWGCGNTPPRPSMLSRGSYRDWRERDGLRWTGWVAALDRGCQAIGRESSEPELVMSSLELG